MKLSFLAPLLLLTALVLCAQEAMPRMSTVDPTSAKVGDVVTITGENLDKANVAKVYLTNQKDDIECNITAQTATEIKVKIPAKSTGRMALMILTAGKDQKLIEQPVKLTIE
jgi:hypothetical protein